MRKIISILLAFALVFNLFGKSFGNNQKLQKNVDETNIYESYLNKKTQKMNIKVTDALSKKLVYADNIDLSSIDEEKILKDIQENQEIEENLEIFETEDDELKDVDHYIWERYKANIRKNERYESFFSGYDYRMEKRGNNTYWFIGKRNGLLRTRSEFIIVENDKNREYLMEYTSNIKKMKMIEDTIWIILGEVSVGAAVTWMSKLKFLAKYSMSAFTTAVFGLVGVTTVAYMKGLIVDFDALEFGAYKAYVNLQISYEEQMKPPKPPYTIPGISYGSKGF